MQVGRNEIMTRAKTFLTGLLLATVLSLMASAPAIGQSSSPTTASANPAAAKSWVSQTMSQYCKMFAHQPEGSLQNIWIVGRGVLATWTCGTYVGEIAMTVEPDGAPGATEIVHLSAPDKLKHLTVKEMADKDMKPAEATQLIALRDHK